MISILADLNQEGARGNVGLTDITTTRLKRRDARNVRGPEARGPARPMSGRVYDRRSLTYANSFENFWMRHTIKAIEWLTGKLTIIERGRASQHHPHWIVIG